MKAHIPGNQESTGEARGSPFGSVASVAAEISNMSYLRGTGDITKTHRFYEFRECHLRYVGLRDNRQATKHASDSKHEVTTCSPERMPSPSDHSFSSLSQNKLVGAILL